MDSLSKKSIISIYIIKIAINGRSGRIKNVDKIDYSNQTNRHNFAFALRVSPHGDRQYDFVTRKAQNIIMILYALANLSK